MVMLHWQLPEQWECSEHLATAGGMIHRARNGNSEQPTSHNSLPKFHGSRGFITQPTHTAKSLHQWLRFLTFLLQRCWHCSS